MVRARTGVVGEESATARKRFFAGDGHVSLVVNHLDELSAAIKTTYA